MGNFNLQTYSLFAGCFLLCHNEGKAEAIYTDIPDTVINYNAETFWLDLDDSGTMDFSFQKQSFDFLNTTYSSGYVTSHFSVIFAEPLIVGNEIAGSTVIWGGSAAGSFVVYHPYAFALGEMIGDSLSFQLADDQNMAFRYTTDEGAYFPKGGNWYPEVIDHYLGIYFVDTVGCSHYGWIRCDVKNNGRELTIKDFAYEKKCDVGILAGDTVGDTTTVGITDVNSLNATVYSFEDKIYVKLSEEDNNVQIHIYEITGKEIYSNILINQFTEINLGVGKGIYLVELFSNKKRYNKKLFLN